MEVWQKRQLDLSPMHPGTLPIARRRSVGILVLKRSRSVVRRDVLALGGDTHLRCEMVVLVVLGNVRLAMGAATLVVKMVVAVRRVVIARVALGRTEVGDELTGDAGPEGRRQGNHGAEECDR